MSFSIRINESAAKELKRIAKPERTRIVAAIDRLAETPHLGTALKGGMRRSFLRKRRLRIGNRRVLYEVRGYEEKNELVVLAVRIAHRGDAYRRRPA